MGEQDTIKKLHDEIDHLKLRVKGLEDISREKNLIKILASLPLPALLLEADDTIQYINTEFGKISGYNLHNIDSLIDLFDLICPEREYRETVMAEWKEAMKENENPEPSELNVDITCKDGSLKNILFRPVKILNNKYVIIARDNTEKKQLQEILKQKLISPEHPDVNTENITFMTSST
jgi:PAS domain S-box-containing protein